MNQTVLINSAQFAIASVLAVQLAHGLTVLPVIQLIIIINFIGQFLKPAQHPVLVIVFARVAMLVARVAQKVPLAQTARVATQLEQLHSTTQCHEHAQPLVPRDHMNPIVPICSARYATVNV